MTTSGSRKINSSFLPDDTVDFDFCRGEGAMEDANVVSYTEDELLHAIIKTPDEKN